MAANISAFKRAAAAAALTVAQGATHETAFAQTAQSVDKVQGIVVEAVRLPDAGLRIARGHTSYEVTGVLKDSPAYRAGIQPRSQINSVNGQNPMLVETTALEKLFSHEKGSVELVVTNRYDIRNKQPQTIKLEMPSPIKYDANNIVARFYEPPGAAKPADKPQMGQKEHALYEVKTPLASVFERANDASTHMGDIKSGSCVTVYPKEAAGKYSRVIFETTAGSPVYGYIETTALKEKPYDGEMRLGRCVAAPVLD